MGKFTYNFLTPGHTVGFPSPSSWLFPSPPFSVGQNAARASGATFKDQTEFGGLNYALNPCPSNPISKDVPTGRRAQVTYEDMSKDAPDSTVGGSGDTETTVGSVTWGLGKYKEADPAPPTDHGVLKAINQLHLETWSYPKNVTFRRHSYKSNPVWSASVYTHPRIHGWYMCWVSPRDTGEETGAHWRLRG